MKSLGKFGYKVERKLILKNDQRSWPIKCNEWPSHMALGRIYWGDGKYSASHWICFYWDHDRNNLHPYLYDNSFQDEQWRDTYFLCFYNAPTKLKSLYFVVEGGNG